jgi:hypothetical protein
MPFSLALARNALRLLSASLRNGTVRFYVGNLPAYYTDLNRAGVRYVVLRWSEDLPMGAQTPAGRDEDIDHLVADSDMRAVLRLAASHPGPLKSDYYSVGGRRGSSYKSMPYYVPERAQRLLDHRRLDPRGFYRPCPEDEFFSFAYHLCYHKGLECGLPAGLPDCPNPERPSKDYAAELTRLAGVAGITDLPQPLDLHALHGFLRHHGWAMPADLMNRWPKSHPFLRAQLAEDQRQAAPLIEAAKGYTVFILRDDCDSPALERIAQDMIAERFTILDTLRLTPPLQARLMARTRGGSWVEKYRGDVVAPTVAIFCHDADTPGPIPVKVTADKIARRYPHLSNTDVLIKRNIRVAVNAAAPHPRGRVVIHATDNAFECAEVFAALFEQDALPRMLALRGRSET